MQLKYFITLATFTAFASASFVPLEVAYTKRSPQYGDSPAPASPNPPPMSPPPPSPAGPGAAQCVTSCDTNWNKSDENNRGGGYGNDYGNDNGNGGNTDKNETAPSPTTKYVVVAPSQGVLRFVPFAMQANVGDKIQFTWMANNHGVTKSSMTGLCNATMDKPFKSPVQNVSATFETMVDTTQPMFYYCPVANHCTSGMYGIINPPMAPANLTNVGDAMGKWEKDSKNANIMKNAGDMMKNANMTNEQLNWGSNWMDMAKNDNELTVLIENIITTRLAIALNPGWTPGAPIDTSKFKPPPDMKTLAESNDPDKTTSDSASPEPTDGGSSNNSGCIRMEAQIISLIFSLIAVFACVY